MYDGKLREGNPQVFFIQELIVNTDQRVWLDIERQKAILADGSPCLALRDEMETESIAGELEVIHYA